jgi:hypothetical protein
LIVLKTMNRFEESAYTADQASQLMRNITARTGKVPKQLRGHSKQKSIIRRLRLCRECSLRPSRVRLSATWFPEIHSLVADIFRLALRPHHSTISLRALCSLLTFCIGWLYQQAHGRSRKDQYSIGRRTLFHLTTGPDSHLSNRQSALWPDLHQPGGARHGDALHRCTLRHAIPPAVVGGELASRNQT